MLTAVLPSDPVADDASGSAARPEPHVHATASRLRRWRSSHGSGCAGAAERSAPVGADEVRRQPAAVVSEQVETLRRSPSVTGTPVSDVRPCW